MRSMTGLLGGAVGTRSRTQSNRYARSCFSCTSEDLLAVACMPCQRDIGELDLASDCFGTDRTAKAILS